LISAVGKCEGAAGAVMHAIVVMRPNERVDDEQCEAAEAGMDGQMSHESPT